jgi:hypothetical protein
MPRAWSGACLNAVGRARAEDDLGGFNAAPPTLCVEAGTLVGTEIDDESFGPHGQNVGRSPGASVQIQGR